MKKLLKILFLLVIIFGALYFSIDFLSNTRAAEIIEQIGSFSFDGKIYPAQGELYYDDMYNAKGYLCADHGGAFFIKRNETFKIVVDAYGVGAPKEQTYSAPDYSFLNGAQYIAWEMPAGSYSYDRALEIWQQAGVTGDGTIRVNVSATSYPGYGNGSVEGAYPEISTGNISTTRKTGAGVCSLSGIYTTGNTYFFPQGENREYNNRMAYILAECNNNVGIPRQSYVNWAFWSAFGQRMSAVRLNLTENVLPSIDSIVGDAGSDAEARGNSLYQEAVAFENIRAQIGDNYLNKVRNNTIVSNIKVEYNAGSQEYIIGPFNISYIEGYYNGKQIAGITGQPKIKLKKDNGSITLAMKDKWDFLYREERTSGVPSNYNLYPHSGENFWIKLNYIEGVNAIQNIYFDFRYMNAEAVWTKSEGKVEKLEWTIQFHQYTGNDSDEDLCLGGHCGRGGVPAEHDVTGPTDSNSYSSSKHQERHIHYHEFLWLNDNLDSCSNKKVYGVYTTSEGEERTIYKCGGHECGPGKPGYSRCAHGLIEPHFCRITVTFSCNANGYLDIQDIGACASASKWYEGVSAEIGGASWGNGGIDLTTTIAGNVWLDNDPQKTNGAVNGIKQSNEKGLQNIGVTVWIYNNAAIKLQKAIAHNSDGSPISWPIYTDSNGNYQINRLEAPGVYDLGLFGFYTFYVVEFEYDGQVFKNSVYLANSSGQQTELDNYRSNTGSYQNASMAVERVDSRVRFDAKFGKIYGGESIDSNNATRGYAQRTNNGKYIAPNYDSTILNYNGTVKNNGITSELNTPSKVDGNGNVTKMEKVTNTYKMTASTYYEYNGNISDNNLYGRKDVSVGDYRIAYPFINLNNLVVVLNANTRVQGNVTIRYVSDYMLHINLGLQKRKETDISVLKDLYSVTLVVNGQKITRQFNNFNTLGGNTSDVNQLIINIERDRINNRNKIYSLDLYNADFNYQSKDRYKNAIDKVIDIKEGTELRVFATYVIRAYNNSETNDVIINEITDYYDSTFSLVTNDVYTPITDENLKVSNHLIAEKPYYRVVTNGTTPEWKPTRAENKQGYTNEDFDWKNQRQINGMISVKMDSVSNRKLKVGDYLELFTTYEIDQSGYIAMTGNKTNANNARQNLLGQKNNIAEVSNYSTYYSKLDMELDPGSYKPYEEGNVSGRVDKDSAPNNINTSNLLDRSKYEDDTFSAVALDIGVRAKERDMYGYVWEDNKDQNLKYDIKAGDGEYKSGENLISNVKVSLYEVINLGQFNSATGKYDETYDGLEYYYKVPDEYYSGTKVTSARKVKNIDENEIDGNYYLYGFLAGDYIVRFDYGTQVDNSGGTIKYNGQDYENTKFMKYSAKDNLNAKFLDVNNNQNVSKARDNESRRLVVDSYSRTIENDRAEILKDKGKSNSTEYIEATKMFAETPIMQIEIEDPESVKETQTPGANVTTVEKSAPYELVRYSIPAISFGLEERAKTDMQLQQYISSIALEKQGEELFRAILLENGQVDVTNVQSAYLDKLTYLTHEEINSLPGLTQQGFYAISVENEFLNDLRLRIQYSIKVLNESDVDFTGQLANYYIDEDIAKAASEVQTTDLYNVQIGGLLSQDGVNVSTNTTIKELLKSENIDKSIKNNKKIRDLIVGYNNVDETDTIRPEVIVYGRYVGRYYYENVLHEKDNLNDPDNKYVITNYSKYGNLADINITYSPDNVVKTTVDQVVDYIDVNTSLDLELSTVYQDKKWKLVNNLADNGIESLEGIISNDSFGKSSGVTSIYDEKNRALLSGTSSNIAISYNEKLDVDDNTGRYRYNDDEDPSSEENSSLTQQLVPSHYYNDGHADLAYIGRIDIINSKTNSSESDANEMKIDNLAEILIYSNPTGRRDNDSVPGNAMEIAKNDGFWYAGYNSRGNGKTDPENDAYAPEYVSIIPPTGIAIHQFIKNNIVPIIILFVVIILLGVMFGIKQVQIRRRQK